eukprot:gene48571-65148_t
MQPKGCMMPPPPPSDLDTDRLLRALADGTRRLLLDRLRDHPGLTLGELLAGFSASRQALSKHLAALEAAGLVVTLWRGREKLHYLDPQPLQTLPARWAPPTPAQHDTALKALQAALEPVPVDAPASRVVVSGNLALALAEPPGPLLRGSAISSLEGLEAARVYAAATAHLVRQMVAAMPPDPAAYTLPESGAFSLAQHLWHLADLETLGWRPRFERLLNETHPRLPGVDGD